MKKRIEQKETPSTGLPPSHKASARHSRAGEGNGEELKRENMPTDGSAVPRMERVKVESEREREQRMNEGQRMGTVRALKAQSFDYQPVTI